MIGVYEIWIGDHQYVGSSVRLKRRKSEHISALKHGKHKNIHMQRAYDKYQTFEFQVLVECEKHSLYDWEQAFIDANYDDVTNMNICRTADDTPDVTGRNHSADTKALLSKLKKGRKRKPHTAETKAKMAAARRAWHAKKRQN